MLDSIADSMAELMMAKISWKFALKCILLGILAAGIIILILEN